MLRIRTTPQSKFWNVNLRNRVGDSVKHNSATWTNLTGLNSEPGIGILDWEKINEDNVLNINTFVASVSQTEFTVSEDKIADNGLWMVQVGSVLLNSTTGVTAFANGDLTIDFSIGKITFLTPLQGGTQVIIKYN